MKKLLSFALILCLLLSLVACGGTAQTDAPESGSASKAPVSDAKLVYWSMWESTEPQGVVIAEAIKAFTAETGIQVDVEFKGRQGIRQGLQPALDAGTTIDIFDEGVDRVLKTWGDYVLDLEQYAAAANYEATAIAPFMTAIRDISGTLKAVPYQGSVYGFFYNIEMFEKAGIKEAPATWSEFLDCCAKLKAAGFTPLTSDSSYFRHNFGNHVARYGGLEAVVDAVMNGNWKDNEAVLKTVQDYAYMAEQGYFPENFAANVWPAGQNGQFAIGDAAMYLNGSWLPNEIKNLAGEDAVWGFFPYPAVEGGVHDTTYNCTSFQVFAINNKTKYPEEAFKLLCWLTQGEWDAKLAAASMGIPSDTTNTEVHVNATGPKALIEKTTFRYPNAAGAADNADVTPVLTDAWIQLAGGVITPEQFIEKMQSNAG